jgi:hypothetical protein
MMKFNIHFLLLIFLFSCQLFSMQLEHEDNDVTFEQYKAAFELRSTILN